MLSDKPKLIFTDMVGKVTLEANLPCVQVKKQQQQTPEQQFLTALYTVGEAIQ